MRIFSIERVSGLLLLAGLSSLLACEQPGEALTDRKRRENDAEIQRYLSQNSITADTSFAGIYLSRTRRNPTGQRAAVGDEIQYFWVARRLDNVVADSTFQPNAAGVNQPNTIVLGNNSEVVPITTPNAYEGVGLYTGVSLLREGETATLLVPSYFNSGRLGTLLLPQYSPVRYDVRVTAVRTENEQINDYIAANKLTVTQTTASGLRLVLLTARPDSALIQNGQTVNLTYVGRLLNGTQFDARTTDFTVGATSFVSGFTEMAKLLRRGERALAILPSSLAYGAAGRSENGRVIIPAYRPLVFDITINSVK